MNTIEQAKQVLRDNGYYVDNLWSIEDVVSNFNCTDDEAQEVLDLALNNDATREQIWYAINYHAEEIGLTRVEK
jgi:hypothetical protein